MHADSVKLSAYIHICCNKQYLVQYLPNKVKMEALSLPGKTEAALVAERVKTQTL
jgi:hypothetical protein